MTMRKSSEGVVSRSTKMTPSVEHAPRESNLCHTVTAPKPAPFPSSTVMVDSQEWNQAEPKMEQPVRPGSRAGVMVRLWCSG
jgi:hypothetical protein